MENMTFASGRSWVFGGLFFLFFINGCATVPYQPPVVMPPGIYHIVGSGQTLYSIAKVYGVQIDDVARLNNILDPNMIGIGQRLFIPGAKQEAEVAPYHPDILPSLDRLIGPKRFDVKWSYITLHHSATMEGNAEIFDRDHRRRKMGGLFYHFVVGNGTKSGDGQVEAGWRWAQQKEVNRKRDIQVCFVGDFNKQRLSDAQFKAAVSLVKILMHQYSIPAPHLRVHNQATTKVTECPGSNFPLRQIVYSATRK